MINFTPAAAAANVARKDAADLQAMVEEGMREYFCPVLIEAAEAELAARTAAIIALTAEL